MDIFSILNYFGITPDRVTPLVMLGSVLVIFVFKHTKPIKESLQDIREKFFALEGKTTNLFKSASPVSLTPTGNDILISSGLKTYLDSNKSQLLDTCEVDRRMDTPYDIQQEIFSFFDTYEFPKEVEDALKNVAYSRGVGMDILRRIGAIYFRDFCLEKHGFKAEDLDAKK